MAGTYALRAPGFRGDASGWPGQARFRAPGLRSDGSSGVPIGATSELHVMKGGWVYIMTNTHDTTLYTGVTSNLMKRVLQHKKGVFPESFTDQYLCHKLVWFEFVPTIEGAIAQEKRIKHWRRAWKKELIEKANPDRKDLSDEWYDRKDLE